MIIVSWAESSDGGEEGDTGDGCSIGERRGSSINLSLLSDSIRAGRLLTSTPSMSACLNVKVRHLLWLMCGKPEIQQYV